MSALETALRTTAEGLATEAAIESIRRDPYWPKWDSPWWQMTLLWEMGEAARIPRPTADAMAEALDRHYVHFFPIRPDEVPPDFDGARHALCHCGLGTMCQVLTGAGIDIHARAPWIRAWFLRYRLPDGGWNCEEAAYLRAVPRSSYLSTLPVLEALLLISQRTEQEETMLDEGAHYLLSRHLCRSHVKGGVVAEPSWLRLTFPRFYDYDVLRGLDYVTRWARLRGRALPPEATEDATTAIGAHLKDGNVTVGERAWEPAAREPRDGGPRQRASTFPLLEQVSAVGAPNPWLTRQWLACRASA